MEIKSFEEMQPKEMIGQGNTAEIYQIDNNRIVKLYRSGFSKYAIEKEYHNSIVAMNNLEFVPRIYGRASMGDREGIVFQQIDGVDMLKKREIFLNIWKICLMEMNCVILIYASNYQKLMFSFIKYLTYKTYIKEYLKISGKRMEDIREWELPVAAARLNETLTNHERQKLICLVKKLLSE